MEGANPNPQQVLERLFETLLVCPDLASSYAPEALQQALRRHSGVEKSQLLKRSLDFASQLQDAASLLQRQHDSACNSHTWPLTHDLTIKVFALLDVHSLSQAAAACSLFNKIAMEPACYRDIDLTGHRLRVDNHTVAKVIERAGQHLRSLKLGSRAPSKRLRIMSMLKESWASSNGKTSMSNSCLEPLIAFNGAAGALLRTLHLHNIPELDTKHLSKAIAACPGLLDLEMNGLHVNIKKIFHSVSSCCHDLINLSVQLPRADLSSNWLSYSIKTISCTEIISGCPNISSLSLKGFKLPDQKAKLLLGGLHPKKVDFSGSDMLTGTFLRDLVTSENHGQLESLTLRDCVRLRLGEVNRFLYYLSVGELKGLNHLDVSHKDGLISLDTLYSRSSLSEQAVSYTRNQRPELYLQADFLDGKSSECDSMSLASSFGYSEYSEALQPSSYSDDNMFEEHSFRTTSSDSAHNSDQDSDDGDHDSHEFMIDIDVDSDFLDENDDQFLSPCEYSEEEDDTPFMEYDDPNEWMN